MILQLEEIQKEERKFRSSYRMGWYLIQNFNKTILRIYFNTGQLKN